MRNVYLSMLMLAYSATSFAMFCPTNLNLINLGDTSQQVEAQCGKPNSIKTHDQEPNVPQEWNYYLSVSPGNPGGTLKVTFSFANNKIINMSANGIGVGATAICNGVNLQLNSSTMQDVKSACGEPAFISQPNPALNKNPAPKIKIEEWAYTATSTPATLVFTNGKLTGRN